MEELRDDRAAVVRASVEQPGERTRGDRALEVLRLEPATVAYCREMLERASDSAVVTEHGDLMLSNLIVDAGRVHVIDRPTRTCSGPAGRDAVTFAFDVIGAAVGADRPDPLRALRGLDRVDSVVRDAVHELLSQELAEATSLAVREALVVSAVLRHFADKRELANVEGFLEASADGELRRAVSALAA
jgi:hypothetical protein